MPVRGSFPTDSACVRVTGRHRFGTQIDSLTVEGIRLRLVSSSGSEGPADSVRVDLLFP